MLNNNGRQSLRPGPWDVSRTTPRECLYEVCAGSWVIASGMEEAEAFAVSAIPEYVGLERLIIESREKYGDDLPIGTLPELFRIAKIAESKRLGSSNIMGG